MRIKVSVINTELPLALRNYAEVRTWLALQRFANRVRWVNVWLRTCNGDRGGDGKLCRMEAWLGRAGSIVVEQMDVDPYMAIDAAAIRLKRAIADRLKFRWQKRRRQTVDRSFALA
ncbi:MAG TPA: HPF/RaiA family ribosome-associated protein [Phycisphaerae bacterium]|jgi:ribosome-associated translation inhibitor RaiA|nr:HPF/RaiA family ribosome-associated protein [Phycisphaerae bacterium]HOB76208.1 HPF/RaiA family ribosome-associated protein [Phycisphaerae bacterium]HOL27496.1 HPF/RaiA family ribosome-associated protein [Phycisphaerae bacterium]HPP21692.1 HPF/RaiA family ribosome-associated protein [Phycisphaerae bacterium]HPU31709.1 HPF/RaiA family ribosome-associated protein [Phycisphaerae bacterium]